MILQSLILLLGTITQAGLASVLVKSWDQSIIIVEQTPKLKSEVSILNSGSEPLKYFQINLTED